MRFTWTKPALWTCDLFCFTAVLKRCAKQSAKSMSTKVIEYVYWINFGKTLKYLPQKCQEVENKHLYFSMLKAWSHYTSKLTIKMTKTGKKFTNKSLMEKINKDQIEVKASFLFSAGLWTARASQIPPRKDSWLSACSPWKNKGDGISKFQTSRNQRGGRSKTNKLQFGCGCRCCQGILQRRARDGGVAVKGKRGKM